MHIYTQCTESFLLDCVFLPGGTVVRSPVSLESCADLTHHVFCPLFGQAEKTDEQPQENNGEAQRRACGQVIQMGDDRAGTAKRWEGNLND